MKGTTGFIRSCIARFRRARTEFGTGSTEVRRTENDGMRRFNKNVIISGPRWEYGTPSSRILERSEF